MLSSLLSLFLSPVFANEIHLKTAGSAKSQSVVFVHGSPGTWQAWEEYLNDSDLKKNFFLIAVDRPGFGKSGSGQFEPSLDIQAEKILSAVQSLANDQKMILVGHSFGGPVILKMAMKYPQQIKKIILVSSPADPELEKLTWYQKLGLSPMISWALPKALYSCVHEIEALKLELEKMQDHWSEIQAQVIILHGKKDSLVPVENVSFMLQKIPKELLKSVVIFEKGNHFLPWNQKEEIIKAITF